MNHTHGVILDWHRKMDIFTLDLEKTQNLSVDNTVWWPYLLPCYIHCSEVTEPVTTCKCYSSGGKISLLVGKSDYTYICEGKISWMPTAVREKVCWLIMKSGYTWAWVLVGDRLPAGWGHPAPLKRELLQLNSAQLP